MKKKTTVRICSKKNCQKFILFRPKPYLKKPKHVWKFKDANKNCIKLNQNLLNFKFKLKKNNKKLEVYL